MSLNYNYNYGLNIVNLTTGNLVSTNVTVNNIYYTGNLIQNGTVSSVLGSSNNYIATNLTTGTLNAGNLTTGNINFTGTLSQNGTPYLGSQWTTTSGNLSYTSGNVVVNNLTTGNLNFTGALSQNGAPYIGSQWTSTAGNISYTSGNVVVTNFVNSNASIGSLSAGNISISGNMTVGGNLLVSGSLISVNVTSVNVIDNNISAGTLNAVISSIGNLNSTNISTGTLYSNTISTTSISTINNTVTNLNSINITATNILANLITSTNLLATNNTLTNTIFTNFTVSNLLANNLNLGISSFFSSSFVAANNITTPTSINGLVFNNTNINYFEIKLSISIVATVNLSQTYNLYGNYNASGWSLFTNFIGDTTGVVFSITAAGQIQYTSTNIVGFVSDTFRYTVQQFSASGTYTSLAATTQGNYIFNTVQVTSTTDSIIGTSTGGIQILGGATISKQVNIQSTNNATGIGSGGSLTVFGGTAISGNMLIGGGISSSLNTNTIGNIFTTGGNVGIGNANPGFTLDVSGTARFTSSITTGSIFSTNITSTNVLGTNITTTNLISNLITVNSLLSTNIFSSNITVTNLVASFTSSGNLTSNTGTFANQVSGSQTVGTLVITTSASLIGNTNTIGNLFTTGGNVGINTTSPGVTFDVIGSGRFTNLFASFTSLGNLTSSTGTFANKVGGSQTVGTLVITTSASLIGNTNTIGNLFTTGGNVGINTVTPGFTLDVSGTGRFTSSLTSGSHLITGGGLLATFNTNTIGNLFTTGGNVGINTPTPAFTLDIAGSTRINNTLLATFNSNTLGNLYTTGGNVGINTTNPNAILDIQKNGSAVINLQNTGTGASQLQLFSHFDSNNYFQTTGDISFTAIGQNTTRNLRLTTGGNVLIGATNTFSPVSMLTINGGNVITGVSQASIAFSYAPTPGFYHFIGSRHNGTVGSNQNSIDFYLYNSTGATGSSAPNFGNVNSMSVTATGVGIFNSNPSYTLDVNGSARISGSINMSSNYTSTSGGNIFSNYLGYNYGSGIVCNGFTFASPYFMTTQYQSSTGLDSVYLYTPGTGSNSVKISMLHNGNVGINTTSPSFALDVNGSARISGSINAQRFNSYTGVINITTTGTYNISPGILGYIGKISVYIGQIPSGIWGAQGDLIMPPNGNIRGNLSNITQYQFSNNQISATLQPFGGSNNSGVTNDNPSGSVQVVVTTLGAPTAIYWTLTIFSLMT